MDRLLISLAACIFGLYGTFVKLSRTSNLSSIAISSLSVATISCAQVIVSARGCEAPRTKVGLADTIALASLYFGSKSLLTTAFHYLPVSTAQPLFFTWVPMTIIFDSLTGGPRVTASSVGKAVLAFAGVLVLTQSDKSSLRVRSYWMGAGACLAAALLTSARIVLVKRRFETVTPEQTMAIQTWASGAVGAIYFLTNPTGQAMSVGTLTLWLAFSVSIYIAYVSVYTGLQTMSASDAAVTLVIELIVACTAGLVLTGGYATSAKTALWGYRVPLAKYAGIAIFTAALLV